MVPNTLNGIARARRLKAAHSPDERRERPLIDSNEQNERLGEHGRARSLRPLAAVRQARFAVPPVFLCLPQPTTNHSEGIPPLGHHAPESQLVQRTTRNNHQLQPNLPLCSELTERFANQALCPISYDSVPDTLRDDQSKSRWGRGRPCVNEKGKMDRVDAPGFALDAKILRASTDTTRSWEPTPRPVLGHAAYFL